MSEVTAKKQTRLQVYKPLVVIAALVMVSLLLAATGIFWLAQWAEASAWHHGTQHVLILLAGAGFGTALSSAWHYRRGDKHER